MAAAWNNTRKITVTTYCLYSSQKLGCQKEHTDAAEPGRFFSLIPQRLSARQSNM